MRIGLLLCDHAADDLKARFGDISDMFIRMFEAHAPEVSLDVFDVTEGRYPGRPRTYDGFIGSGSRWSVYDDIDWIVQFKGYVARLFREQIPFVGICFGHQMIAEALGGKCERSKKGWGLGINPVSVFREKPWMDPPLKRFSLLLSHLDQVIMVPEGSEILGGNDHCPCSLFTVGGHFLGIQGHPEFTADFVDSLITSRADRIDAETMAAARKTLDRQTDEAVVTSWIINFIKQC